ncbi:hypothetical protein C8R44DRAFT_848571 [Mycena epipterygia]|nr:hypothetical protein C8R44DRAFT_848571 [Mycena epipterygia]
MLTVDATVRSDRKVPSKPFTFPVPTEDAVKQPNLHLCDVHEKHSIVAIPTTFGVTLNMYSNDSYVWTCGLNPPDFRDHNSTKFGPPIHSIQFDFFTMPREASTSQLNRSSHMQVPPSLSMKIELELTIANNGQPKPAVKGIEDVRASMEFDETDRTGRAGANGDVTGEHKSWKRLHRKERALCRFLLARHVQPPAIRAELGWSLSTIYKIKKDRYKEKDVRAEDDKYVGEEFYEIWRKLGVQIQAIYKSHVHRDWEHLRREERALCRSLLENGVQPPVIHAELGWSLSTIRKIKNDNYVSKDTNREDEEYTGEEFDAVLKKIQERASPSLKRGRKKRSRVNERQGRVRIASPDHTEPLLEGACADFHTYLMHQVCSVSREEAWLGAFRSIELSDSTLRHFADPEVPRARLKDFLNEKYAVMKSNDLFILENVAWAWDVAAKRSKPSRRQKTKAVFISTRN